MSLPVIIMACVLVFMVVWPLLRLLYCICRLVLMLFVPSTRTLTAFDRAVFQNINDMRSDEKKPVVPMFAGNKKVSQLDAQQLAFLIRHNSN